MAEENIKKSIIAIIPARGGSKGIPRKNIIDFCGQPLLAWSVRQAQSSKYISQVYVSTDDQEIARVTEQFGGKVIWRPDELSGDTAKSEDALKHAISEIQNNDQEKIDYVVFLQATSPLREMEDIDNAIEKIILTGADSLFSGADLKDFCIWRRNQDNSLESINYDYKNRGRRQDFGEQYVENGSIYIFRPEILFKFNNRLAEKIVISKMEFWKSFEVDEPDDLEFCKNIFKLKGLDKK